MVTPGVLGSILGGTTGDRSDAMEEADSSGIGVMMNGDRNVSTAAPVPGIMGAAPAEGANQHQQNLLQQLMRMTDEDLAKLPPEGRESMRALKEQILGQLGQQS